MGLESSPLVTTLILLYRLSPGSRLVMKTRHTNLFIIILQTHLGGGVICTLHWLSLLALTIVGNLVVCREGAVDGVLFITSTRELHY